MLDRYSRTKSASESPLGGIYANSSYSYLNAIIGSTRIARRAGM